MKIGKINQQGDITTRHGNDPTNNEAPKGESFNITTGSSLTDDGGSINLILGSGTTEDGSVNIKSVSSSISAALNFHHDANFVSIKAPDSLSQNVSLILPSQTGTTGQFLKSSNSSGNTSWAAVGISDVSDLQNQLDLKIDAVDAVNIEVLKDMYAPTGFVDKDMSTISFNNTTRTFTIAPISLDFEFYVNGTKFTKSVSENITIANTTGFWFIYYDNTGTMVASTTPWSLKIHAPIVLIYWNASVSKATSINEERHGVTMDWATHSYLHNVMGTQWRGGLAIGDFTTSGDGSSLSHAQMSLTNGSISDEDLVITITNSSSPAAMTFQQTLSPVLTAPVIFNPGTGWESTAPQTAPIISGSNGRASFNAYTAGTYSMAEAQDGNYVAVWIIAIPNYLSPIFFNLGTREDITLDDAKNNNIVGDIIGTVAPFAEVKFLYRLIYQTSDAYSNSVKARLVDVADVRNIDVVKVATPITASHSELSNLAEDDHNQYIHNTIPRTVSAIHTFSPPSASAPFLLGSNAQGQLVSGLNADQLDGFSSSDFQPIDGDLTSIAALTGTVGLLKKTAANTWELDTSAYLTDNQTITLTGDVTGSGTTAITTALANTAVTPGSGYNTFTVDSKGRITAASTTAYVTTFGGGATGLTPSAATSGAITLAGTLVAANGGTGQSSYAVGDILFANTTSSLSRLPDVATGNALISGGVGVAPSYGKIGLTTHISGTLALANGGTGSTTAAGARTNLGLVIGTNVQAFDADLTAIAALTGTNGFLRTNGAGTWTVDTNTYLTDNQTITVSGDATGSGTTAIALTLANTAVTPGSGYNTFTVDSKGRVTAASTTAYLTSATGVTTFGGGTTGLTPSTATSGAITLSGTLSVANGGTGQTTYTNGQLLIGNTTGNTLSKATLTAGSNISITNGAGSITIASTDQFTGTVTSVAALTLGTTGTDITSSVANGTTTPVITLNVPTASATNRGALSSADWSTFNGKQASLVSGTNIKTVGGLTLLGAGDVGTIGVGFGGTGLTSVTANNLLVGNGTSAMTQLAPSGTNSKLRWSGSTYSWATDNLDSLSDVVITSPTTDQILTWDGINWVNQSLSSGPTSFSVLVTSWTLVSGNLYSATVTHNLGTRNVSVTLYDSANNTIIYPDSIVLTSANAAVITVAGNSRSLNVTVMANGTTIAPSSNAVTVQVNGTPLSGTYSTVNFVGALLTGSSASSVATVTNSAPIQRLVYQAASLESPNNSDWAVNALAPVINDATYPSINIRSFTAGAENGVGFYWSVPSDASSVTFNFKGRAATAPGASSTVILRLYSKLIPNNSAPGAWSAATTIITITLPTNAFYQYNSVTIPLSTLGLTAGNFYEFEMTRNGGTLASAWNMAEMVLEAN